MFGLAVGWLLHLVADGMWERTGDLPVAGVRFGVLGVPRRSPIRGTLFTDPFEHWRTWGGELVGLAALAWFWVAFELGDPNAGGSVPPRRSSAGVEWRLSDNCTPYGASPVELRRCPATVGLLPWTA